MSRRNVGRRLGSGTTVLTLLVAIGGAGPVWAQAYKPASCSSHNQAVRRLCDLEYGVHSDRARLFSGISDLARESASNLAALQRGLLAIQGAREARGPGVVPTSRSQFLCKRALNDLDRSLNSLQRNEKRIGAMEGGLQQMQKATQIPTSEGPLEARMSCGLPAAQKTAGPGQMTKKAFNRYFRDFMRSLRNASAFGRQAESAGCGPKARSIDLKAAQASQEAEKSADDVKQQSDDQERQEGEDTSVEYNELKVEMAIYSKGGESGQPQEDLSKQPLPPGVGSSGGLPDNGSPWGVKETPEGSIVLRTRGGCTVTLHKSYSKNSDKLGSSRRKCKDCGVDYVGGRFGGGARTPGPQVTICPPKGVGGPADKPAPPRCRRQQQSGGGVPTPKSAMSKICKDCNRGANGPIKGPKDQVTPVVHLPKPHIPNPAATLSAPRPDE